MTSLWEHHQKLFQHSPFSVTILGTECTLPRHYCEQRELLLVTRLLDQGAPWQQNKQKTLSNGFDSSHTLISPGAERSWNFQMHLLTSDLITKSLTTKEMSPLNPLVVSAWNEKTVAVNNISLSFGKLFNRLQIQSVPAFFILKSIAFFLSILFHLLFLRVMVNFLCYSVKSVQNGMADFNYFML